MYVVINGFISGFNTGGGVETSMVGVALTLKDAKVLIKNFIADTYSSSAKIKRSTVGELPSITIEDPALDLPEFIHVLEAALVI